MSAWLLRLIGGTASLATRDSIKVSRAFNQRCYPHAGNGGHSWRLGYSLSLTVRAFILDKAIHGPALFGVGTTLLPLGSCNHPFFKLYLPKTPLQQFL